jgi:hypothetical protein
VYFEVVIYGRATYETSKGAGVLRLRLEVCSEIQVAAQRSNFEDMLPQAIHRQVWHAESKQQSNCRLLSFKDELREENLSVCKG